MLRSVLTLRDTLRKALGTGPVFISTCNWQALRIRIIDLSPIFPPFVGGPRSKSARAGRQFRGRSETSRL
jgi:hypothetical protein